MKDFVRIVDQLFAKLGIPPGYKSIVILLAPVAAERLNLFLVESGLPSIPGLDSYVVIAGQVALLAVFLFVKWAGRRHGLR